MRGLKYRWHIRRAECVLVAPYAGAWIEMAKSFMRQKLLMVAPYAGAWIEITAQGAACVGAASHPTRVRGLKLTY